MDSNVLPEAWATVTLESVAEIHDNLREPVNSTERKSRVGPFPYYGATGQVGWIDDFRQDGEYVLLGEDGAPFFEPTKDKAYLVSGKCWVNNHAHVLKGREGVCLNRYLLYALNQVNYRGFANGTTRLKLTQAAMRQLPINLAPLAEQHRIVTKIEELFSELDQGVASLKAAREQLKVYRQSLLKNAFEGKLTAAIGWREKPLGQLLGFLTSGSRGWAAYYATSGDLFVRAQNIKHDRLELDDVAFVSLPDKAEGLRTRIQQGDLLITITGANVTKSALVKHDLGVAYVSQHVALCRPTTEIQPEYLYWFIVAEAAGRKQLTDMAYGAGKPGLNLENIRSVNVTFPSLHEQQEIVEQIESKLSEADQLDQTLATALQQADALRQSILKKAFCGQLVEQDKNDEPAIALLESIRAGKANGIKRPGKTGKVG